MSGHISFAAARAAPATSYSEDIVRFLRSDSAYGVLEYSLILGLIAMLGIAALLMLGGNTDTSLRRSVSNFPSDNPNVSPTF